VGDGVSETIGTLYGGLFEHAEEVFQFTRIRGLAIDIPRYGDDALEIHPGKWNLIALNNAKTIAVLKDKERKQRMWP